MSLADRGERLGALATEREGLDLLIVGDLVRPGDSTRDAAANLFWLTGFRGTSGLALVGPDSRVFLTDFRYTERAAREVDGSFERRTVEDRLVVEAAGLLEGRVGFDDSATSIATLRRLEEAAPDGVELVATSGLVEELRRTKEPGELAAIAEAARLADEVYEWTAERGLAGRTERDVALAAEQRMRELGAEDPSFPAIVAAAENSALPHHQASGREIDHGELVLIDMGAIVDGYCSDCTRTFAVGDPGERARDVYELVLAAQRAALAGIRSGIEGPAADALARDPITAAGHGERFGHGLGHGVGIEVHEPPRLSTRSEDTLRTGDVVTVEPGVYLPGELGVRIEDLVSVTDDGVNDMSGVSTELRLID